VNVTPSDFGILVSVIVPVYNGEKYLRECLCSVAAQTRFASSELIIVDDGSADGSNGICLEYAARYENVRVIRQENAGVSAARNAGLDAARGTYISFADADDKMNPDMLEILLNAAEKTGADMAVCGMDYPYTGESLTVTYPFEKNVLYGADRIKSEILPFMLRDPSMNSLCTKIFRRGLIEDAGLRLTPGLKYGEDREFVLRFLGACLDLCGARGGVCFVPDICYYYRRVEGSAIHRPRFDLAATIFERLARDRVQFARLGVDCDLFERTAAPFVAEEISGALHIARRYKGKARRDAMRGILCCVDVAEFLDSARELIDECCSDYVRLILKMVRRKSVAGVRFVMFLMRARVLVYNAAKRVKGSWK